jgi:hypothetical protein
MKVVPDRAERILGTVDFCASRIACFPDWINLMKTAFAVFCFLCATVAFGQAGSYISSSASPTVIADHPLRASVHDMASDTPLVGGSAVVTAHGERPMWDFGPISEGEKPLGDIARDYRKQRLNRKKAERVLEKQE